MAELADTAEYTLQDVDLYGISNYDLGRFMYPEKVGSIFFEVPLEYDQDIHIMSQQKTPISEKGAEL